MISLNVELNHSREECNRTGYMYSIYDVVRYGYEPLWTNANLLRFPLDSNRILITQFSQICKLGHCE